MTEMDRYLEALRAWRAGHEDRWPTRVYVSARTERDILAHAIAHVRPAPNAHQVMAAVAHAHDLGNAVGMDWFVDVAATGDAFRFEEDIQVEA